MRIVLLETSGNLGEVGLADEHQCLAVRALAADRKHARDLVPLLHALLTENEWAASTVELLFVSQGPGSYTGLRVGLMAAKTLAYVIGCPTVSIDSMRILAEGAPRSAGRVATVVDAQQGRVYFAHFGRGEDGHPLAEGPTRIGSVAEWIGSLQPDDFVIGPGLERYAGSVPCSCSIAPREAWQPRVSALHAVGMRCYLAGQRDDFWTLEPTYLRPSSAEQKWDARPSTPPR